MLYLQSYKKLKKILLLHNQHKHKKFATKISNLLRSTRRLFDKVFSVASYNFITKAPIFIKFVSIESYEHVLSFVHKYSFYQAHYKIFKQIKCKLL